MYKIFNSVSFDRATLSHAFAGTNPAFKFLYLFLKYFLYPLRELTVSKQIIIVIEKENPIN